MLVFVPGSGDRSSSHTTQTSLLTCFSRHNSVKRVRHYGVLYLHFPRLIYAIILEPDWIMSLDLSGEKTFRYDTRLVPHLWSRLITVGKFLLILPGLGSSCQCLSWSNSSVSRAYRPVQVMNEMRGFEFVQCVPWSLSLLKSGVYKVR